MDKTMKFWAGLGLRENHGALIIRIRFGAPL